jgi:putative copper export protein
LAAINKLKLTPRLKAGDLAAAPSLRRTIHAEMALAALILLTTAAITTLIGPPALG